jgi:hypothetical protein
LGLGWELTTPHRRKKQHFFRIVTQGFGLEVAERITSSEVLYSIELDAISHQQFLLYLLFTKALNEPRVKNYTLDIITSKKECYPCA